MEVSNHNANFQSMGSKRSRHAHDIESKKVQAEAQSWQERLAEQAQLLTYCSGVLSIHHMVAFLNALVRFRKST